MKEEADLDVLLGLPNFLAQHLRQQHEMIVVDPDQIPILSLARNSPGKEPVRIPIRIPRRLIEGDLTRVVVEERPEDRI